MHMTLIARSLFDANVGVSDGNGEVKQPNSGGRWVVEVVVMARDGIRSPAAVESVSRTCCAPR